MRKEGESRGGLHDALNDLDRQEERRQRDVKSAGPMGSWGEDHAQESARLTGDPHGMNYSREPRSGSFEDTIISKLDGKMGDEAENSALDATAPTPKITHNPGSVKIPPELLERGERYADTHIAQGYQTKHREVVSAKARMARDWTKYGKKDPGHGEGQARIRLDAQKRKVRKESLPKHKTHVDEISATE